MAIDNNIKTTATLKKKLTLKNSQNIITLEINETKHNTKVLWKTINDIANYKKSTSSYIAEV